VASLKKSVHLQTKIPDGPKKNKIMGVAVGWLLFFFVFSACISQINTPGALLVATECSTSLITIAHYMQFIVNVSTRIEREMSGRCARNVRLAAATMHTNESVHIGTRATGSVTSTRQLGRERNSIWPGLCSYTEGMNYFWFDFFLLSNSFFLFLFSPI
jgi:hypothetical protein